MTRLLLILPNTSYRAKDFLEAAGRLGIAVTVATDVASSLEELRPADLLSLDLADAERAADRVLGVHATRPFSAVVAVDDLGIAVAATVSERLGLRHNPVSAVETSRHKGALREALQRGGFRHPPFRVWKASTDPLEVARKSVFPCVLKPTFLSASRGVQRCNDPEELARAWFLLQAILEDPDVRARGGTAANEILVEGYLPGCEVALEGLLESGSLAVLALFDKPDPLEGPTFEETIYVTPSRLSLRVQSAVAAHVREIASFLGLSEGPLHAELRIDGEGVPWLLELAPRSIGGLCSRVLSFTTGWTLEELILRHALGMSVAEAVRDVTPSGVMMIPVPGRGKLLGVLGREAALGVPDVTGVQITAHVGQDLVPLPEGSTYVGFIFARGATAADVERSLRAAHHCLEFELAPS